MKRMMMAFLGSILLITSANATTTPLQPVTKTTSNPLHCVQVTDVAGLLVNCTLDVSHFLTQNGRIWAVCKLRGICGGLPIDEDCLVPITIGDCDGGIREIATGGSTTNCDCIIITFNSCTVNRLTGAALELLPQQVRCTAQEFPAEIICQISGGIREVTTPVEQIAGWMNQLL
jgi:hypothetical protein